MSETENPWNLGLSVACTNDVYALLLKVNTSKAVNFIKIESMLTDVPCRMINYRIDVSHVYQWSHTLQNNGSKVKTL